MALTLDDAARNAAANAVVDLLDVGATDANGDLEILHSDGTTVLVRFELANPAFGAASAGVVTLAGVPLSATAIATGTATTARMRDRDNANVISGMVCGTVSGDVILDSTSITSGQTVNITAGTITMPAS